MQRRLYKITKRSTKDKFNDENGNGKYYIVTHRHFKIISNNTQKKKTKEEYNFEIYFPHQFYLKIVLFVIRVSLNFLSHTQHRQQEKKQTENKMQ